MSWMTKYIKIQVILQAFLIASCIYYTIVRHDWEWGAVGALVLYSMYLNVRGDWRQHKSEEEFLKRVAKVPSKVPPRATLG